MTPTKPKRTVKAAAILETKNIADLEISFKLSRKSIVFMDGGSLVATKLTGRYVLDEAIMELEDEEDFAALHKFIFNYADAKRRA